MKQLEYYVRVYIFKDGTNSVGLYLNDLIDGERVELVNTFLGIDSLVCFYDLRCDRDQIFDFVSLEVPYLPLNKYEDFTITCPHCGERIDDDMILKDYSDPVMKGMNIDCDRRGCGFQLAKVEFIG